MQMRFSLLAITTLAATALAQTTTLPNGFTATEGNTSSAYPFGRGNNACRVQHIYDSANMVLAGMNAPCFINTIEWRANTAAVTLGGTHAGAGVTLKIGTCAFDHLAVTNTFNNNFATSTVFNINPVSVATGAGTTPNNYTTMLTVPGGYFFDPAGGTDLVVEVSFPAGTWTGMPTNTTASAMDYQSSVGCGGSRLFSSVVTAATATPQLNLAAIIRLGWTAAPGAATNQSYGIGCGTQATGSFFQTFADAASAAAALSNTSITLTPAGSGYLVTNGGGTYMPPSGTATNLALGDDTDLDVVLSGPMPCPGGPTSVLRVCSNGFISRATGNGTNWVPTPGEILGMPQTVWAPLYTDWSPNEAGSGFVKFEEIAGIAYVTWDGVERYLLTEVNPGTMQVQFDVATGLVRFVYGTLPTIGGATGAPSLVGHSPGGPSANPGAINLATGLPIVTSSPDVLALSLSAGPRPVLNTTVTYTINNISPAALVSVHVVSFGGIDPGIDWTGMGAPGCWQYVDLSACSTFFLPGGPSVTNTFFVPNDPGFVGLDVDNQSASLVPGLNALGVSSSNAVVSRIGSL